MSILSRVVAILLLFFIAFTVRATNSSETEKIDINSASLEDLVKIIHIGEVRAQELISLRPFSSLDELSKIKGLGELRIEDIKKQGLAWVRATEPEKPVIAEPAAGVRLQQTYPSGIIINEILPSPEGPDEKEEWIEVFNQNDFEVELSNWQITDANGKTTTFVFPAETKIAPTGFLVFSRPTTKITLNNDEDGLNLIWPNGKVVNSVNYEKAPRGQSYSRTEMGWTWGTVLTPGSANVIPESVAEEKENKVLEEKFGENVPEEKAKDKMKPKQGLAAIGKQVPEEKANFFSIFSVAFAIAIFSGIVVFFLKKKVKTLDLSKKLE